VEKYEQTVWSILTNVGFTERSLGIHASAQEVLARPDYPRNDTTWSPDRIVSGVCCRAVHLHVVLIQTSSAVAAVNAIDARGEEQGGDFRRNELLRKQ